MWGFHRPHLREDDVEREKVARLEQAETELTNLKGRASRAINALDERHRRNHWRESIEHMIQGGI